MKTTIKLLALAFVLFATACSNDDEYDMLNSLWRNVTQNEARIDDLEKWCAQANTNITSLQTIVNVIESNDAITSITPVMEGGVEIGYTITFSNHDPITIYHGKDGKDGQNGANGQNGTSPIVGVAKYTDGVYYWTLNGEWLLDADGNKLPVSGKDGANGENGQNGSNGQNGVTPLLKIENDYWWISYDNGNTWTQLGKAKGKDGENGQNGAKGDKGDTGDKGDKGDKGDAGDSMFQSVTQDADNVYFTLADGTIIKIAKGSGSNKDGIINFEDIAVKSICVSNWDDNGDGELSVNEASKVLTIGNKFSSNTNIRSFRELQFFTKITEIPVGAFEGCSNLFSIEIPENIEIVNSSAFKNCSSLVFVKFLGNKVNKICGGGISITQNASSSDPNKVAKKFNIAGGNGAFGNCTSLKTIHIPSSVQIIEESAFANCKNLQIITFGESSKLSIIKGTSQSGAFAGCVSLSSITIPASVDTIGPLAFGGCTGLSYLIFEPNSNLKYIGGGGGYCTSGGGALHGAFCFCPITNLQIPSSVTYIGHSAFYGCQTNTIIIPSSVTQIGAYVFTTSSNTKIICEGKSPALFIEDNKITYNSSGSCVAIESLFAGSIHSITVPYGYLSAYQTTYPWSSYSSKIVENDY